MTITSNTRLIQPLPYYGKDSGGHVIKFGGASLSLSADGTTLANGSHHSNKVCFYQPTEELPGGEGTKWGEFTQAISGEVDGDNFGFSVSLSADGTVVAIGAPGSYKNGENSGHVGVYQNVNYNWIQIGTDIDGKAAGDKSGYSVSLSADGSVVAIGAPYNDGNGNDSGHVRVYQNVNNNWIQIGTDIDGKAVKDESGHSVSLSADGSVVAIGAPYNSKNGVNSGHVRVYQNVNNNWIQIGTDIDGEAAEDESGHSVSLSADGSVLAIGAPYNSGNGIYSGHVRVYRNVNNNWVQIGTDIDGEAAEDKSGYSVSLSADGSVVAIGASHNDGSGNDSGHVRVYQNVDNNWVQIGTDIGGEAAGDESGYSVSLSADGFVLATGAPRAGKVAVYQINDRKVISTELFRIELNYSRSKNLENTIEAINRVSNIIKNKLPSNKLNPIEIKFTFQPLSTNYPYAGIAWPTYAQSITGGDVDYQNDLFGTIFPAAGEIVMNSSESNKKELMQTLYHEIFHILGIGDWLGKNIPIFNYAGDVNNRFYNGEKAFNEYKKYYNESGGRGTLIGIPIENDGGAGTKDGHPEVGYSKGLPSLDNRTANGVYHPGLQDEVMAGIGPTWLISRVTIGMLEDLGYSVDYDQADNYKLVFPRTRETLYRGNDNKFYTDKEYTFPQNTIYLDTTYSFVNAIDLSFNMSPNINISVNLDKQPTLQINSTSEQKILNYTIGHEQGSFTIAPYRMGIKLNSDEKYKLIWADDNHETFIAIEAGNKIALNNKGEYHYYNNQYKFNGNSFIFYEKDQNDVRYVDYISYDGTKTRIEYKLLLQSYELLFENNKFIIKQPNGEISTTISIADKYLKQIFSFNSNSHDGIILTIEAWNKIKELIKDFNSPVDETTSLSQEHVTNSYILLFKASINKFVIKQPNGVTSIMMSTTEKYLKNLFSYNSNIYDGIVIDDDAWNKVKELIIAHNSKQ